MESAESHFSESNVISRLVIDGLCHRSWTDFSYRNSSLENEGGKGRKKWKKIRGAAALKQSQSSVFKCGLVQLLKQDMLKCGYVAPFQNQNHVVPPFFSLNGPSPVIQSAKALNRQV